MADDIGARPTDQALVASDGAAGVSTLSGFDPSRDRRVDFTPAFDKRSSNPATNYGIGSMHIRFVLIGPLGAVQWLIGTPWYVASARKPGLTIDYAGNEQQKPEGWDLGYHSPRPMYDGQQPMDCCDVLPGQCFYDGSGLNADLLIEGFLERGNAYVWEVLEAYYQHTFADGPWPFNDDGSLAIVDTRPKDGDAKQAPLAGSAAIAQGDSA